MIWSCLLLVHQSIRIWPEIKFDCWIYPLENCFTSFTALSHYFHPLKEKGYSDYRKYWIVVLGHPILALCPSLLRPTTTKLNLPHPAILKKDLKKPQKHPGSMYSLGPLGIMSCRNMVVTWFIFRTNRVSIQYLVFSQLCQVFHCIALV